MANEMKNCPFCAEDIKAQAIVCRYCGRDLQAEQENKQSERSQSQVTTDSKTRLDKSKSFLGEVFLIGLFFAGLSILAQIISLLTSQTNFAEFIGNVLFGSFAAAVIFGLLSIPFVWTRRKLRVPLWGCVLAIIAFTFVFAIALVIVGDIINYLN